MDDRDGPRRASAGIGTVRRSIESAAAVVHRRQAVPRGRSGKQYLFMPGSLGRLPVPCKQLPTAVWRVPQAFSAWTLCRLIRDTSA